MKEEIKKEGEYITIKIPYWTKRTNPYIPEGEDIGKHKTLIGIIAEDQWNNEEMGFALVIDMSYKGKNDQYTDIKYHFWGDEKEFNEICKKIGIDIIDIRKKYEN